jgi:hypothetical protein
MKSNKYISDRKKETVVKYQVYTTFLGQATMRKSQGLLSGASFYVLRVFFYDRSCVLWCVNAEFSAAERQKKKKKK